jgi:hypothetical protein
MHCTKHLWALTDLRDEFHVGQTANDSKLVTEQVGNIQVRTMGGHEATILSVNYSPSMPVNLLSLGWLYKRGYVLKESDHGNFIVHKETGTKMFKVYIEGGDDTSNQEPSLRDVYANCWEKIRRGRS